MDITPLIPTGRQVIRGYGDGGFTVAATRWEGGILVFPERTVAWGSGEADELLELLAAADWRPELILLGCGLVRGAVPVPLRAAGYRVEAMDTGAACRTFNVLLAEDRRAVAALVAV